MPLKTFVKVGSITNLSDARYCAGMGVDLLGFAVKEGVPNYIAPKAFQEIRGWITGPQIVAEVYGIHNVEQLAVIIEHYRPDYLELGLSELQSLASGVTLPFILRLTAAEEWNSNLLSPAYFLLPPGSTHQEKIIPGYDVLMSASTLQEVTTVLHKTGISGVALSGGSEIRPGVKAPDELAEILEALETDS
jgi:phosphoribosylanthranilate isomerase